MGTNMARLAIAWCLKNPNVSTVITGASRVEQVYDNMHALKVADQLTDDVMEKIEAVLDNKPEPVPFQ
jgi:aryl-alcohol dehydrogenase-like predicted oxidoreductase